MALTYDALAILFGILGAAVGSLYNRNKQKKIKIDMKKLIQYFSLGILFFAGVNLLSFGFIETNIFGQKVDNLNIYIALGGIVMIVYGLRGIFEKMELFSD